ncbi:MAG: DUF3817 domain-containing protein [Phycisphaerae bacterium]
MNLDSTVGRLRLIGMIEGISFLVLLGIAMPLKYLADRPEAVQVVGWIHGVLFVMFCLALALASLEKRWRVTRIAMVFAAALIPFGPFIIDGKLKREE